MFDIIADPINIFKAWKKFKKGKMKKKSLQDFDFSLEHYIISISKQLKEKNYKPLPYESFYVYDPKKRHIHSAQVLDRVVQQAVFQIIEPIFNRYFIHDSYSSRKGTHKGVRRLESFMRKVSNNYNKTGYVLKCDISRFFDSIDHSILKELIKNKIEDKDVFNLLEIIIDSFERFPNKGLPLGNVTSQLFGNIYMHKFDHFIKHDLKIKYYVRYCDDFVIVHEDKKFLENLLQKMEKFLLDELSIVLHKRKREIRKISQGVDFLGYIILPHYKIVRHSTKRRIFKKIEKGITSESLQSYLGILSHCKNYKLKNKILVKASERFLD